ncbi:MAG: iron ABC transporter permease, partial [Deltaproteobacteria bacterium]|nr:iron ABC transporter permease [Deltaproteobacteria bacterium]
MNRFQDPKTWILLISATLLLYFGAFPLLLLAFKSFLPEHIGNYALILSKKSNWISMLYTFYLCALTTLFSVGLGLPLAWLLSKTDLPRSGLWKSLFTIPYIVPPYVGAIAWLKLLNPTSGSLNLFFKDLFHLQNTPFNIYTLWGAAFVLSLFFYSFILLACTSAFENMDASLEEASRMCGAGRLQTFKKITLPLLTPALLSGIVLVSMATATAFGVPALLLMPVRKFVLTTKIYTDVLSYSGGIMKAASLSVLLMILGLVGLWLSSLFLKNKR